MKVRPFLFALICILAVLVLSSISVRLWGGKPEVIERYSIKIDSDTLTVMQIIEQNGLPARPVIKALDTAPEKAATATLKDLDLSPVDAASRIEKTLVLYDENRTKNWIKIFAKFILWFAILPIPFTLLYRSRISPRKRRLLVGSGVFIFGVALGADPSPMGTVKDAVFLLTAHKAVFWPRMVALSIFLLIVVLANKFICSWGCQFGLLQEFIFRLNRRRFDRKGIVRQYKPPFVVTNSIRAIVFAAAVATGLAWAFDIIGIVDPFKIYNPASLALGGIVFLGVLLIASPFVYRPWCHFACPFGLVSWVFEKTAIFKIKVNYKECIACDLCERACPSTVMGAILKRERVIPDCFGCGVCIESCPTDAVHFTSSRAKTGDYVLALENKKHHRAKRKEMSE